MGDNKNLILAAILSLGVLLVWDYFIIGPQREEARIAAEVQAARQAADPTQDTSEASVPGGIGGAVAAQALSRDDALGASDRVPIDSTSLDGSINLTGGRLDDLNLKQYRVTIEEDSPEVTLLSPSNGPAPYYSVFGWAGRDAGTLPDLRTPWQLVEGDTLGVGNPVVLEWVNDNDLTFRKTYEVDDDYLFTITQEVTNGSGEALTLRPYGLIARHGEPETLGMYLPTNIG